MKLTKAQRNALIWFCENGPASSFRCDGVGPSLRFVKHLVGLGLVEKVGVEKGQWGFTRFDITTAGRAATDGETKP